jgi:hypothetical protein
MEKFNWFEINRIFSFKIYLIIFLSLACAKIYSQEVIIRMNCDFDKEFISQIVPCRDLSNKDFNEERRALKIKTITKLVDGDSLDSVYRKNPKWFRDYITYPSWDHTHYAYVKQYEFDEYGILKSYLEFPISNYLSKEDSLKLNKRYYRYQSKADTITSSFYDSDRLLLKSVYYKGKLIYKNELLEDQIWIKDSINKGAYTNKVIGYTIYTTKYYYLPNGKVDYIIFKGRLLYRYKYLSGNRTEVTYIDSVETSLERQIDTLQNLIVRNKSNKLEKSIYYTKGEKTFKKVYSVLRDNQGEVIKIIKKDIDKYTDWESSLEYDCKNVYKDNKLISTEGRFSFEYYGFENVQFKYNSKGLLESSEGEQKLGTSNARYFKESIKYTFY